MDVRSRDQGRARLESSPEQGPRPGWPLIAQAQLGGPPGPCPGWLPAPPAFLRHPSQTPGAARPVGEGVTHTRDERSLSGGGGITAGVGLGGETVTVNRFLPPNCN